MKQVTIMLETQGQPEVQFIKSCDTVAEAEDFIAHDPSIDPARREAGDYSIDAPEEMING